MESQEQNTNNKVDQIKSQLNGIISKGDSFYIGFENDNIIVRSISDKDSLRATNPELHGVLLKYEQRMMGSGNEIWLFILVPILISSLIAINPFVKSGLDLSSFQTWWLYIGLLLTGFILNNWRLTKHIEKKYQLHKKDIKESISKYGVSIDYVISLIAKDGSLFNVKTKLMMDE